MLEIYNDECRDLLHPEIPSRDIALREDKEGRMFFTGAREEIVADKKVSSRRGQALNLLLSIEYTTYVFLFSDGAALSRSG